MGRHTLNNCDYFAHKNSMRNHRKVKALRNKFGSLEGYAFWSMMLEYLTGLDGNEMEYNDLECEMFAAELGLVSETIKEMIDFSIKIELLFNKNGFIHSISLDEELAAVYEKRKKSKEASAARRRRDDGKYLKTSTLNGQSTINNPNQLGIVSTETNIVSETKPHSIVEYSIVEYSRVEDIPPVFVECKNFFINWFEGKEKKICEFDVADYVSFKRIIEKLRKQFVEENKIVSEFKKVFENWHNWDESYKNKLKFTQIELYWPKIIESIYKNKPEMNGLTIAESFEKFWNIYDKNINRLNCEKAWIKLTPEERIDILNYIQKYVLATPDKTYRKDPENFLIEQYWHNEIVIPQNLNGRKHGKSSKPTKADVDAALRKKIGG